MFLLFSYTYGEPTNCLKRGLRALLLSVWPIFGSTNLFFFAFFEAKVTKIDIPNPKLIGSNDYHPFYIQILWFVLAVFLIMIRKSKRGLAKIVKLRPKQLNFSGFFSLVANARVILNTTMQKIWWKIVYLGWHMAIYNFRLNLPPSIQATSNVD